MKYFVILIVLAMTGCPKKDTPVVQPTAIPAPTRIVLFVGDGMGVGSLTAATYAKGDRLAMSRLPAFGYVSTHEYEFPTTDSAASATALATGHKTHFNGISVKPGTSQEGETDPETHLQTWFEIAKSKGLGTGIVTTSRVNHATPAAFLSHRKTRKSYDAIAEDMVNFGPDVLLGSGSKYFNQREDGKDLIAQLQRNGWTYVDTPAAFVEAAEQAKKLVGLFYEGDTPFLTEAPRAVPLPDMFDAAVKVLDRSHPDGWVLMVEGSFIDWCAHGLDPRCVIEETLEFDETVARGHAYAKSRNDTLIAVTADHETGGLSVIDPAYATRFETPLGGADGTAARAMLPAIDGKPQPWPAPVQHFDVGEGPIKNQLPGLEQKRFTTVFGHLSVGSAPYWKTDGRFYSSHSAEAVPLWAAGPHATWLATARDNAELGAKFKELVNGATPVSQPVRRAKTKNVIIMIGDGMGLPVVSAAGYRDGTTAMFNFPVHGIAATHAGDKLVADSAATGTAISTGKRSGRHRVGVDLQGTAHPSVLEMFSRGGASAGIVTTTEITHATPAAFFAHQESRIDMPAIIGDLLAYEKRNGRPLDLLFGGGAHFFKEVDLTNSGYVIERSWPPTRDAGPTLGMFAERGLLGAKVRRDDNDPGTPTLAEMTELAITRLSKNERGFALLVEGGQIDWRLHELDRDGLVLDEVADFDDAVAVAKRFAERDQNTTVIVTADHDHTVSVIDNHYAFESGRCGVATVCGGPDLFVPIPVKNRAGFDRADLQSSYAPPVIHLQYAWLVSESVKVEKRGGPHSARFVPIFSYGPGADLFSGYMDQPEIGQALLTFAPQPLP